MNDSSGTIIRRTLGTVSAPLRSSMVRDQHDGLWSPFGQAARLPEELPAASEGVEQCLKNHVPGDTAKREDQEANIVLSFIPKKNVKSGCKTNG